MKRADNQDADSAAARCMSVAARWSLLLHSLMRGSTFIRINHDEIYSRVRSGRPQRLRGSIERAAWIKFGPRSGCDLCESSNMPGAAWSRQGNYSSLGV